MATHHCLDCRRNTHKLNEYYMVTDKVWRRVNPEDKGMLCIKCLETRLGRQLIYKDFLWCPLNVINVYEGSKLLRERLGCDFLLPPEK